MSADDSQPVRVSRPSEDETQPEPKPIVLNYKQWKKKGDGKKKEGKPRYSKGLEDVQRLEGDFLRVTQTGARAFSKSIDTYEEERSKSARKKTDGAIEDFLSNSGKATSTFLKESSDIPIDVADSLSKLSFRKNLRKALRRSSKTIRTWSI